MTSWVALTYHKPLTATFCSHRLCQRGHITLLICHVAHITMLPEDHVIPQVGSSQRKSPICHVWSSQFSMCHMTSHDHMIRGSSDIMGNLIIFPHHKLPPCQVWQPRVLRERRYFVFNLSRQPMRPRSQRIIGHYG